MCSSRPYVVEEPRTDARCRHGSLDHLAMVLTVWAAGHTTPGGDLMSPAVEAVCAEPHPTLRSGSEIGKGKHNPIFISITPAPMKISIFLANTTL
jgi:hypothetical protein